MLGMRMLGVGPFQLGLDTCEALPDVQYELINLSINRPTELERANGLKQSIFRL